MSIIILDFYEMSQKSNIYKKYKKKFFSWSMCKIPHLSKKQNLHVYNFVLYETPYILQNLITVLFVLVGGGGNDHRKKYGTVNITG